MRTEKLEMPFDVELLPVRELSAGKFTCLLERGNLRYIKWNDQEVVRMIYTAVRDKDWATASYEIKDEKVEAGENSFSVRYTAFYQLHEIQYKAAIQIEATGDSISFSMQGEALSDFYRNRIGICVHHPVQECAGKKVTITHPDGERSEAYFPEQISPHQPFKQVREMQWETDSSAIVHLSFEGDVFETEDQRNWTDHSFKTYSTPLNIPFPSAVKKGDALQQRVLLKISDPAAKTAFVNKKPHTADVFRFPFPKIGYERAPGSESFTADEVLLLQDIPFDHYRVVLHLSNTGWIDSLDLAAAEAKVMGPPIEVVAFFSDPAPEEELTALSVNLQRFPEQLSSILLLQEAHPATPVELLQKAYPILKAVLPHVKVGYGTYGFFAELNRNRPSTDLAFDFVSYSLNPQVHATDTRTLLENLAAQRDTVSLVKTFAPQKEVFVSPVTFKIREGANDVSSTPKDEDQRMFTSFGALWTLLAIKNLAAADRITLYQVSGYRGILHDSGKHPLYKVLAQLKTFNPKWIFINPATPAVFQVVNNRGEEMAFSLTGYPPASVFV